MNKMAEHTQWVRTGAMEGEKRFRKLQNLSRRVRFDVNLDDGLILACTHSTYVLTHLDVHLSFRKVFIKPLKPYS